MIRSIPVLWVLCACASAAPERGDTPSPRAARNDLPPPPDHLPEQGDTLPEVTQALGERLLERRLSPTESILEGLYGEPCQEDLNPRPQNLDRPPCGAARLLRIRMSEGRVISVEWGDPDVD